MHGGGGRDPEYPAGHDLTYILCIADQLHSAAGLETSRWFFSLHPRTKFLIRVRKLSKGMVMETSAIQRI
jgi:hypothetical protein